MSNIPIFLSSDNNYAPFVATTIASICDNTKSFCEFYILDGGISEENKKKIRALQKEFKNFTLEFILADVDKYFKDYPSRLHYTQAMYTRFLIPQLKPDLEKVLYSDVDVIVLADIKEMFDENIEDYPLGAVSEEFLGEKIKQTYINTHSLSKNHQPFASGNLIINCDKWRKERITENLLSIDVSGQEKIKYDDQTLMNIYFDDNYKQLNQRYCYTIQHYVCMPSDDVVICHFNGMVKPWQLNENTETKLMPYLKEFWHYAKMTPFYEELHSKTLDNNVQNNYLNKLKIFRIMAKKNFLS